MTDLNPTEIYRRYQGNELDFFDSWISKHPRRTLDAYYQQYWMAKSLDYNPIPRTLSFMLKHQL